MHAFDDLVASVAVLRWDGVIWGRGSTTCVPTPALFDCVVARFLFCFSFTFSFVVVS